MNGDKAAPREHGLTVLESISAPLGFFVLALLIVETFLGTVLIGSKLDVSSIPMCIYLGVAMFVLVVVVVAILVWFKPDHLTFDSSAHLKRLVSQVEADLNRKSQLDEWVRRGMYLRMNNRFPEAIIAYERAVEIDKTNEEAVVGLAVSRSYADPDDQSQAIQILDEVVREFPTFPTAWYNRACLRCLNDTKYSKAEWLEDLKKSLELIPSYRDYARRDEDFKKYWSDPEFTEVVATPIASR